MTEQHSVPARAATRPDSRAGTRPDSHAGSRPAVRFNVRDFTKLLAGLKPKYWQLAVGVALGLVATGMQLAVPQLAQSLINDFSKGVNVWLAVGVGVLMLISGVFSAGSGTVLGVFGEDVVRRLRSTLWAKLLRLPVKYFDNHKSGEIASRLVNDSTQVKDLLANTLPNMLTSLFQLVGALVLMLMMDWRMTLLMFVCVPLVVVVVMPVARRSRKIAFARQDELAGFSGEASEVFSEIRLVKSSTAEKAERKAGIEKTGNLYKIGVREALYDSIARPIMSVVMLGLVFGMLAYGASRVAQGSMTMGALVSLLMYLVQLIGPFSTMGQLITEVSKASGSTARIQDVLSTPEEEFERGESISVNNKTLSMKHVSFAYTPGEPVLNDISFDAKPHSVIAFAGPSGGGKSTIFSLVERFYAPASGELTIGDEPVGKVDLAQWRRQIGFVSQDAAVLDGSVRYNLTYGLDGEWSDEELWTVLSMAYAEDFVRNMPDGLNTQVGERGVKLSGGQRQRIAIARAFLRDPKILMLDEATASLDSESEMMVQKALEKLMKDRTTLVIAHRLSTIVGADQIYFVEQGRVSGHGTHDELVKSHTVYREYVKNQFSEHSASAQASK